MATLSLSVFICRFSLKEVDFIILLLDVSERTLLLIIKSSEAKNSPEITLIFSEFCLKDPSKTVAVPKITPSSYLINDSVDPLL